MLKHLVTGFNMSDEEKTTPTGSETWQSKMPKVPRYYSPTELLDKRVTRLDQDYQKLRKELGL